MRPILSRCISVFSVGLIFCLLGACVSNQKFEEQVAENRSLSKALEVETQRREILEKQVFDLRSRLTSLQGDLLTLRRGHQEKKPALTDSASSLKETLSLAEEMGGQFEAIIKGEIVKLEREYAQILKKTEKGVTRFQRELEGKDQDILRIKNEITEKLGELVALLEGFDLSNQDISGQ